MKSREDLPLIRMRRIAQLCPEASIPVNSFFFPWQITRNGDDVDFVKKAYVAAFKRWPDAKDVHFNVEKLKRGELERIDILHSFLNSKEGKHVNAHIFGVSLYRWVVGFKRWLKK